MNSFDLTDFVRRMEECPCLYGHFTAKSKGNPIIAYIERRETTDPYMNEEGITTYYVVKHCGIGDTHLWDESELNKFLAMSAWSWDFHKKEEAK